MFHGSIVAIVTPMTEQGALDYNAFRTLIDWHLAEGTDAFVFLGSTGEGVCLDEKERSEMLAVALSQVDGRKPVIAGTGSQSTAKTIELTKQAAAQGVDACLVVTPYYNRPPQEGLYRHYASLSDAVPLPIILYNVPTRTAVDLLPETVERLAKMSNIVGIKDATGKLERLHEMRQRCGEAISYYSGDDSSALEFIKQGGQGVISVTTNVAPKLMHELCAAALAKNYDLAAKIDAKLADLHKLLCIESNPIPTKWVLSQVMNKLPSGTLRLPLVSLSAQHHDVLRAAITTALN